MKKFYLMLATFFVAQFSFAQIILTSGTYTQDFNTLAISGTTNVLAIPGWSLDETGGGARDNEQYAFDNGGSNTGDTYSYGATSVAERALGGLRSGTLIPNFGAQFTNNSGSTITSLTISYTGEEWRLGTAGRTDQLDFQYSLNATSVATGTWTDVNNLDFVTPSTTTTGAKDGNISPNRTAITFTITGLSIANGSSFFIRWIEQDASGADDGLAVDDFSLSFATGVGTPTVSAGIGATLNEPSTNGNFVLTLSAAQATNTDVIYTISGTATSGSDYTALTGMATVIAGNTSVSILVTVIDDGVYDPGESVILTLGTPPSGFINGTASATLVIGDNEPPPSSTKISLIQGTGTTATPGSFTIDGIVTGVFPDLSPAGFYVQEEDADADGNPLTSEAIYVVSTTGVSIGDRVGVIGTVQENAITPSFNQAVIIPGSVNIISNSNTLPSFVNVSLPLSSSTALETVEGMRVQFPQTLYVTDNSEVHRFGGLLLSSGSPLAIPTQIIDPNDNPASGTTSTGGSNVAAVTAQQAANDLNQIYLEDGKATAINEFLTPVPYFNPVTKTIRIGDNITGLSGIMNYSFSAYRVQPPGALPAFTYTSRPAVPTFPAADITTASFNVLNYFNGDGLGGGFPTSRGANTAIEFTRQRDKIISAISAMNADVVGLIELENDGTGPNSAIQNLVNGLNTVMGAGTYSFVNDGASVQPGNGDEIRCGIIYKPAKLTPDAGGLFFTTTFVYTGTTSTRPSIAQIFTTAGTGKKFAFVVNHFKSKGGTGTGANADQNDGQGSFNNVRRTEAQNLVDLITTSISPVTNRVLAVGDFNAYQEEDPMDLLRGNSYMVLAEGQNSYEFGGQLGALDHAVATPSLSLLVIGAQVWNINSTEPIGLDYNDDVISTGTNAESVAADFRQPYLYTADPYSSSDHDPILIGLSFPINLPVKLVSFNAVKEASSVNLSWTTSQELNSKEFVIERSSDGMRFEKIGTVAARGNTATNSSYQFTDVRPNSGNNFYRLKTFDNNGYSEYSRTLKINFDKAFTVSLTPNPVKDKLTITLANSREPLYMQLTDMNGKIVLNTVLYNQTTTLPVTGLSKGLYLVKLKSATATYTEKLIVE